MSKYRTILKKKKKFYNNYSNNNNIQKMMTYLVLKCYNQYKIKKRLLKNQLDLLVIQNVMLREKVNYVMEKRVL